MAQKPSYEALEKKIESLTRENRELGLMLKEREIRKFSREYHFLFHPERF
jgi:hypothetical protein